MSDVNEDAFRVVSEATNQSAAVPEEVVEWISRVRSEIEVGRSDEEIARRIWPDLQRRVEKKAASTLGRRGGEKGGAARAKKLSPKRRKEIARKAAKARWEKDRKSKE